MSELSATLKIRLEPVLRAELEREAAETERTPSAVARLAIREHFARRREAQKRARRER